MHWPIFASEKNQFHGQRCKLREKLKSLLRILVEDCDFFAENHGADVSKGYNPLVMPILFSFTEVCEYGVKCHEHAHCSRWPGRPPKCKCNNGWEGDGKECKSMY